MSVLKEEIDTSPVFLKTPQIDLVSFAVRIVPNICQPSPDEQKQCSSSLGEGRGVELFSCVSLQTLSVPHYEKDQVTIK